MAHEIEPEAAFTIRKTARGHSVNVAEDAAITPVLSDGMVIGYTVPATVFVDASHVNAFKRLDQLMEEQRLVSSIDKD